MEFTDAIGHACGLCSVSPDTFWLALVTGSPSNPSTLRLVVASRMTLQVYRQFRWTPSLVDKPARVGGGTKTIIGAKNAQSTALPGRPKTFDLSTRISRSTDGNWIGDENVSLLSNHMADQRGGAMKRGSEWELLWSPDSRLIAVFWEGVRVLVFDRKAGGGGTDEESCLFELVEAQAVGIRAVQWTLDSRHLLVALDFQMGMRLWPVGSRRQTPRLYLPFSASTAAEFSEDGKYMAMIHRKGGVSLIGVHECSSWTSIRWVRPPEWMNPDQISFAKGAAAYDHQTADSERAVPLLYIWESTVTFRLAVYSFAQDKFKYCSEGTGSHIPSFPIRKITWSTDGSLAALCLADPKTPVLLWNAVLLKPIRPLHGIVGGSSSGLVRLEDPVVVFREVGIRDRRGERRERAKYDAAYETPPIAIGNGGGLSSGEKTAGVASAATVRCKFSPTTEYVAIHSSTSACCVSIYECCGWAMEGTRRTATVAVLVQRQPVTDYAWYPATDGRRPTALLAVLCGTDQVYLWQPDGAHCIPHPQSGFGARKIQWPNVECMVLSGSSSTCLAVPEVVLQLETEVEGEIEPEMMEEAEAEADNNDTLATQGADDDWGTGAMMDDSWEQSVTVATTVAE